MILGIIGGMGPAATVYFMDMLTRMTDASCDGEHLEMLKPKGIEPLPPRKALFGLNIPLSLGIRRVFLRFAGIFILKNHLSSVRGKFQTGIFVPV
jgi:hypothetical protein